MLFLRASDVEKALRPETAVQAVREAFIELSSGRINQPKRTVIMVKGDWWAVMQSATENAFVAKVVNVIPRNVARNKPAVTP
jgi:ornithine cyclodeaminase (EC 4.3.1.12)